MVNHHIARLNCDIHTLVINIHYLTFCLTYFVLKTFVLNLTLINVEEYMQATPRIPVNVES